MLIESSKSKVGFTWNLITKLRQTEQRYARLGKLWYVPKSLVSAMKRWRSMVVRYNSALVVAERTNQKPRFLHSDSEARAEADVALWVLNKHRELNGSTPVASMERFDMPWLK